LQKRGGRSGSGWIVDVLALFSDDVARRKKGGGGEGLISIEGITKEKLKTKRSQKIHITRRSHAPWAELGEKEEGGKKEPRGGGSIFPSIVGEGKRQRGMPTLAVRYGRVSVLG